MSWKKLLLIFVVLFIGANAESSKGSTELAIQPRNLPSDTTEIEPRCLGIECKTSCTGVTCPSGQVCVMVGGKPACKDRATLIAILCEQKNCTIGFRCVVYVPVLSLGLFVAVCIDLSSPGPTCADISCPPGYSCVTNNGICQCVDRASLRLQHCTGFACPTDRPVCSVGVQLNILGLHVAICIALPTGILPMPVNCLGVTCEAGHICVAEDGFAQCLPRIEIEIALCALQNCPSTSNCVLQASLLGIWIAVCLGCLGPNCPNTCQNIECPSGCVCFLEHGTPMCVKRNELEARLCSEKWCPPNQCCSIYELSPGVWQAKCTGSNQPAPTCDTLHCSHGQVCFVQNGIPTCVGKTDLEIRLCLLHSCPPSQICIIVHINTGIWVARCQKCIGSNCPNPCSTYPCPLGQVCVSHAQGDLNCEIKVQLRRRLCKDFYCPSNTQCDVRSDNCGRWFPVCVPCTTPNCGRPPRCNISCRPGRVCIIINGKPSCEKLIDIRRFLCARIRCRLNQRCVVKQRLGPPGFWFAVCINILPPTPVCNLKCGHGFICRLKRGTSCRRRPCPLVPKCVVDPSYNPCLYRPPCPAGFQCVSVPDKNCRPGQPRSFFSGMDSDMEFSTDQGPELDPASIGVMGDLCMTGGLGDTGEGSDFAEEPPTEGNLDDWNNNEPSDAVVTYVQPQQDQTVVEDNSNDDQCLPVAECQPIPGYDPCLSTKCPKGHYCITIPDRKCESVCDDMCSASEESLRDVVEKRMTPSKPKVCPRIAKCISKRKCPPNPCQQKSCKTGFVCKVTERTCEDDDFDCCHRHPVCIRPPFDSSASSSSEGN